MLHQLHLSAKLNTVARLDAQANKKLKVSKVGATQYYHLLNCIGKRGATRSVENPCRFWVWRAGDSFGGTSCRPVFWREFKIRFNAVFAGQSSKLFRAKS